MRAEDLPSVLPIFPLQGALLLPRAKLPLHVFEPRYRAMTEDALAGAKAIGMIQPRIKEKTEAGDRPELYRTGCLGEIVVHQQAPDGRHLIVLEGVCRFDIRSELAPVRGYRLVVPEFLPYAVDFVPPRDSVFERAPLIEALKRYLAERGLKADWKSLDEMRTAELVDSLAAMCPFTPAEKQALLEARDGPERARMLMSLFSMGGGPENGERKRALN